MVTSPPHHVEVDTELSSELDEGGEMGVDGGEAAKKSLKVL